MNNHPPVVGLRNFGTSYYEAAPNIMAGSTQFSAMLALIIGGQSAQNELLFGNHVDTVPSSGWGIYRNADTAGGSSNEFRMVVETSLGEAEVVFDLDADGAKDRLALLSLSFTAPGNLQAFFLNGGLIEAPVAPPAADYVAPVANTRLRPGQPIHSQIVDAAYIANNFLSPDDNQRLFRSFRRLGSLKAAFEKEGIAYTNNYPGLALRAPTLLAPTIFPNQGPSGTSGDLTISASTPMLREVDFDIDFVGRNAVPG